MSAARVFAPPRPSSLLARRPSQKRKRHDQEPGGSGDDEDAEDEENTNGGASSVGLSTPAGANTAAWSASELEQYHVAGLPAADDVPASPFPHAAASKTSPGAFDADSAPQRQLPKTSLKLKHLDVLTTILHRCLLAGDYERGARAWAMLLRAQLSGHALDPRALGRWAIGAEMLLRLRGTDSTAVTIVGVAPEDNRNSSTGDAYDVDVTPPPSQALLPPFGPDGPRAARTYLERLILQFPYQRSNPHAVNSLTFYPHFFGLWVYEVTESSRQARDALFRSDNQDHDDSLDSINSEPESAASDHSQKRERRLAELHAEELTRANQIADRLDQLLLSPPTDNDPDLLHLRGMIALWIGDLKASNARKHLRSPGASDEDDDDKAMANFRARSEAQKSLAAREAEVERAKAFFRRARQNGAQIWEGVQDLMEDR